MSEELCYIDVLLTTFSFRIVLGAVSKFLAQVLVETGGGGGGGGGGDQAVLLLPGVRTSVAEQLVEFIYTGYMKVLFISSLVN